MDARMQKHRMTRWLGRVFVVLSLVVSYEVQAMVESVAPIPPIIWWADAWPANEVRYASVAEACSAYHLRTTNILTVKYNQPGTFSYVSCIGSLHIGTSGTNVGLIFSYMNCPVPSSYTYRPYWLNWESGMCERTLPDTFTITLSGGNEVEPSKGSAINTLPIIATVIDRSTNQPPTNQVNVRINLKVAPTSGGHDHGDSTRPRGGIADVGICPSDEKCWSSPTVNGAVAFNFNAPKVSGTHTITVTCDRCSNTATKSVDVKVDGLEIIPDSPFYTFIGETDKHTDNHYLTPEAAAVLWRIAVSYQVEQQFKLQDPATGRFTVTPPVLHVNDASLKWGGKFDLSGRWSGPHYEHKRGTVVDVRANTLDTAVPGQNFDKFILLVNRYGADALLEEPDINRRHFHLRLLNREE